MSPPDAPPPVVPATTDRRGLTDEHQRLQRVRRRLAAEGAPLRQRWSAALVWAFMRIMSVLPARVLTHYMFHGGPLMAAGLAYQLLFASTSLLVMGFSVLGMVLGSDSALQQTAVEGISQFVPGLLDVGDGSGGVIPVDLLSNTAPFSLASTIAAGVLVFTAWRWVAGVRLATRRMFEVPPAPGAPLAAVPRDLAWLLVLGVLLLASAAVSVVASGAVGTVLDWFQRQGWIEPQAWLDSGLTSALTLVAGLFVDLLLGLALVRGVSQLKLHRKALLSAILTGAIGSQALRYAGAEIIAGSAHNPYLFSFAILVGVLVWFNFYGQILLVAAATGAVVQADIRGARAQPEREPRALTVVAAWSLPAASRGRPPYDSPLAAVTSRSSGVGSTAARTRTGT